MLNIFHNQNNYLDYIFKGLDSFNNIRFIEIKRPKITLFRKVIRKVLSLCNISFYFPLQYFQVSVINSIRKINTTEKVLIIGVPDVNELRALAKLLPQNIEAHLWYWNPIKKEYRRKSDVEVRKKISLLASIGFIIETYDFEDATKFNLTLRNQFYRFPSISQSNIKFEYDFYFLGYVKDRENEIKDLKEQLIKLNFRVNFKIVNQKSEEISYKENIENILKAKCIIDINQKCQSGITLRPLESIFFNRKLLTNNHNVLNLDFYNNNNIFILGMDDICFLEDFLEKEIIQTSIDVMKKYEINNWLNYYD